jgi:Domain of unknown function (DUF5666)
MKKVLATLFLLVLMASRAYAHNGMEHVMGTVASITDNSITVTMTDGKSQTVTTTAATKYTKMDAAIVLKDIKVGDHVVIHATKKDGKLIAATVQVGMGKMAGMKMDSKGSSPSPQTK